ncbi:MAG: hypothetical protein L0Z62_22195 [Gemmataceae bacterium]|nr:hypothetical protein [Gemmataceae bacterium]
MGSDFPAAHSMDSCWFAVDRDGHVGFFDTGENGILPEQSLGLSWGSGGPENAQRRMNTLAGLLRRVERPEEWAEAELWFVAEEMGRFGLFVYEVNGYDILPGAYVRTQQPALPLHVDSLPPDLREALTRARFAGLCFADAAQFYPADHVACRGWGPASLCGDGKTVRPLPGRERECRELCRVLCETMPGETAGLRFEGLEEVDET